LSFDRQIAGIQKHFIFGGLGLGLGKVVDGWRNDYLAERDATLRHYVQLHPEDFPDPGEKKFESNCFSITEVLLFSERKKYAELLLNWVPVR
jgi:NADH-ubiquinone oxidoreductase subunit b14.5b (NDUFC2)